MKKIPLLTLFTLFLGIGSFAQRNCQTVEYTNDIIENHPQALQEMMEIERHTAELQLHPRLRSGDQLIKIPVVVHILYNNAKENISDAIVHSQLEVLNEDYRMLNPDQTNEWAQAADINIEFYLASTDPQGNPTNGIIRRYTTYSDWNTGSQMKFTNYGGSDAWPSDQYLNIWVVDLKGGKMGFAQMPGGPAKTDGVVIDYAFFGRTNNNPKYGLGRTATHEIGHWLNLRHIWGDGGCHRDDFVSDTPSSDRPSTDCAEDKFTCGSKDMVANFMDYSYDYCMNLFTEGQKTRMRSLFAKGGFREDLLRSSGLDNHPQGDENSRVEDNHNAEEEETEQEEEDNKNNDQDQEEEENESTQQSDNESEDVKGNCSAPTNLSAHI
ncbi:MAG: zinc metalloprotease, partial [Bacteroidota bacterium]